MLSVFATLEEAFYLWVRNFKYLAIVAVLLGMPDALSKYFDDYDRQFHAAGPFTLWFLVIVLGMLFNAIGSAAILGLLKRKSAEEEAWPVAGKSIDLYLWPLFRKGLLLLGIAIIVTIPLTVVALLLPFNLVFVLMAAIYLIFLKYALADPLIVVENMDAIDALKRSWEMTRNHFGYVLGCYLFLAAGDGFFHWLTSFPIDGSDFGLGWAWVPTQFAIALYNTAWIILSWCMYLRIKEAEAATVSAATEIGSVEAGTPVVDPSR